MQHKWRCLNTQEPLNTVDILSAFFSYHSSSVVTGAVVYSTCRIVSRLSCKKPPTESGQQAAPRSVRGLTWKLKSHEPSQHCVRVNNSSPLSVGSSVGQRLEYSSVTYACCRDPGGITECCYHLNTVGFSMFPLQES